MPKQSSLEHVVTAPERLDRLVAFCAGVSRREARMWISQGRVQIGRHVLKILARVIPVGAKLHIETTDVKGPSSAKPHEAIKVIYLDRYLVAVSKPPGLLSETDRAFSPSLETEVPKLLASLGERRLEARLVHRLDAGTSGVVVLGRTPLAIKTLNEAFAQRSTIKTYIALHSGKLDQAIDVNKPLGRIDGLRQGIVENGRKAHTRFEPLASKGEIGLVRARPFTGRTHQIRVHLAALGCPILGDRLYGGLGYLAGDLPRPIGRPMLHAFRLEIPHPKTGQVLKLEAEIWEDFAALCDLLGF